MPLNKQQFARYVKDYSFRDLFNDLGWNNDKTTQPVIVDNKTYMLQGIAVKSGFKIMVCDPDKDGLIPEYSIRKKIDTKVTKLFQEHLIIFTDAKRKEQVWQLVVRQNGKPAKLSDTRYFSHQDPELLFQKVSGLLFNLDEEENITIVDVTQRVNENFHQNAERVTKNFYTGFQKQHKSFYIFIKGIDDHIDEWNTNRKKGEPEQENKAKQWYVSLMLNRLMFCYFIQKKRFLDNNKNYLREKLNESKQIKGKDKFYSFYRNFLLVLFHKGLNEPEENEKRKLEIGKIPYLNGGLFDEHELETTFDIEIDDEAFESIFNFFDEWEWHLDTREHSSGKDINPDVIGYIFEKYINERAKMGVYYTKEDITDYISKNCIIPWLFEETARNYPKAFAPDGELWQQLKQSGDTYIYPAVKQGVEEALPTEITKGITNVAARGSWNKPAPARLALPTEIWREVIERRKQYEEVSGKISTGTITNINDFITYNLNIREFAQDAISNTDDPEFLKEFYKALTKVTILDPTCGSGAFLFAAMNILEPLYYTCIIRMRGFTEDEDQKNKQQEKFSNKYKFFRTVLASIQTDLHPSQEYFIYKSIILNNLYGVDIMKEAVEIAKLRLFLKLVATVTADYKKPNLGLEPLPDIDFNIRSGNTLVGFATEDELKSGGRYTFDFDNQMPLIEERSDVVAKTFAHFKEIQLSYGDNFKKFKEAKKDLNDRLKELNNELNKLLHKQAEGIKYNQWVKTHHPFHWFSEFYEIIHNRKGFDVIIGNPPYIDFKMGFNYTIAKTFSTAQTKNLYAIVIERCTKISKYKQGYIVPISSTSTEGFLPLQKILKKSGLYVSTFDDRPSHLFDGLNKNTLSILLINTDRRSEHYATDFKKWSSVERPSLFQCLKYEMEATSKLQGCLPKIGNHQSSSIWNKIFKIKTPLSLFYSKSGSYHAFYSRKVNSFLQSLDFTPEVYDGKGKLRPPSEFKILTFSQNIQSKVAYCLLNSNLFRWFIDVTSDGSHLNKRDIDSFPINLNEKDFDWSPIKTIASKLTFSLQNNSEFRTMKYSHDTLKVQCIIPKLSKAIIDEVDMILANHYGLSDTELDFIINYDIKYRLGKDMNEHVEAN